MSTLSVAQIVLEAQRLAGRVKDLDALGSALLVEAESNNRLVESLRKFQDDVDSLNHITNSKSNAEMVNRIQQQNANSSEILKENRELKVCLEDYERAMELIMQKYREHASSKVLDTQTNLKDVYNEKLWKVIRDQREKINEMAAVMHHAASVDDAAINRYLEIMSNLQKENNALRELLQISKQFGSANRPIRSNELLLEEKSVQTETDDSADDELSTSCASVENVNNITVAHAINATTICTAEETSVAASMNNINNNNNNNHQTNEEPTLPTVQPISIADPPIETIAAIVNEETSKSVKPIATNKLTNSAICTNSIANITT